jgi:hypothetical protein
MILHPAQDLLEQLLEISILLQDAAHPFAFGNPL